MAVLPGLSEEAGEAPELTFLSLEAVFSSSLVAEKIPTWEGHPAPMGPSQVLAA